MKWKDRIQDNPSLLRLKNKKTNEIIDFEIQQLEEEEIVQEGTQINAENLQDMDDRIFSGRYKMIITQTITGGTEITIPCSYKVGKDVLDVYFCGEKLIKGSDTLGTDGNYCEVGEVNSISNKIKTTTDWDLETGDALELVVRGDYSDDT